MKKDRFSIIRGKLRITIKKYKFLLTKTQLLKFQSKYLIYIVYHS